MDEVAGTVRLCFAEQISGMEELLSKNQEHFLLCGLDPDIVSMTARMVETYAEEIGRKAVHISSPAHKDENPDGKVFFIKIDGSMPTSRQSLVYHYLEKARDHPCCLVLVSDSCASLDALEKRVKSRFNHRVFFISFLPLEPYSALYKQITGINSEEEALRQHQVDPSISALSRREIIQKYSLPEYSIETLYSLFNPVHIVLIVIALRKRIRYISCVSEFKAFTSNVNEFRKTGSMEILVYFLDILDSGIIDKEGVLLVDASTFKKHVSTTRPMYLRNLMHRAL